MESYRKFYKGDPAKGLSDFDRKKMKQKNNPKKHYVSHPNMAIPGRARRKYVKSHINQYKDDLECIEDMTFPSCYNMTKDHWFDEPAWKPKVFKFRNF
jgi:hypothetical protein